MKFVLSCLAFMMAFMSSAFAAGPDFTTLTTGIDITTAVAAVMAVAAIMVGWVLAKGGAGAIVRFIRGLFN